MVVLVLIIALAVLARQTGRAGVLLLDAGGAIIIILVAVIIVVLMVMMVVVVMLVLLLALFIIIVAVVIILVLVCGEGPPLVTLAAAAGQAKADIALLALLVILAVIIVLVTFAIVMIMTMIVLMVMMMVMMRERWRRRRRVRPWEWWRAWPRPLARGRRRIGVWVADGHGLADGARLPALGDGHDDGASVMSGLGLAFIVVVAVFVKLLLDHQLLVPLSRRRDSCRRDVVLSHLDGRNTNQWVGSQRALDRRVEGVLHRVSSRERSRRLWRGAGRDLGDLGCLRLASPQGSGSTRLGQAAKDK